MNQERIWNILIENELYRQLKVAKNDAEKEFFIERYSNENGIPIDFIQKKIEKMKQQEEQRVKEDEGR